MGLSNCHELFIDYAQTTRQVNAMTFENFEKDLEQGLAPPDKHTIPDQKILEEEVKIAARGECCYVWTANIGWRMC